MANTYVDYTGDGNTTSFAYTFAVLSGRQQDHIIVGVDDSTTTGGKFEVVDPADYTIDTSAGTITFNTAPESGARIRIRRDSDASTLLVDFKNGTVLPERDLDLAYLHNLFLNEEIEEGSGKKTLVKDANGNYDGDSVKLVNLADPENAQDAVTKGYADGRYVDEAGDTMTGSLAMSNNNITGVNTVSGLATPTSDDHAANKKYVDDEVADEAAARVANDALQVTKAGDSMSGNLTMTSPAKVIQNQAPTSGDDLTNKTYVDNATTTLNNDKVSKSGDTMTGALTLPGADPSSDNHATRKRYVDQQIAVAVSSGTPGGPIDTANIADDAVTAAKLDHTTVTPGSYTNTDITVDENGRITAASNGSSGAGATNLSNTPAASSVDIESSTGTNTTVAGATTSLAGVMTGADKNKLNGIATGATANSSDATLLSRANHTGTQTASTISDFDTEVANNTAVAANTAKVTNATHTGDVTGDTALTIANNAVTAAKISGTDAQFLVDDTSTQKKVVVNDGTADVDFIVKSSGNGNLIITDGANNAVGIGTTANAGFALTSSNAAIGTSLVVYDTTSQTEGGQILINKAAVNTPSNTETDSYLFDTFKDANNTYEHGTNADILRIVTPGTARNATTFADNGDISVTGAVFPTGDAQYDLGKSTLQWGTIYASAVNVNGNTSFVSKSDCGGWFNNPTGSPSGLQNGGTYTFTHNLGTTDLTFDLYVSSSSSGTNPQSLVNDHAGGTSDMYGAVVTNITSTQITVQLGNLGYLDASSSGTITTTNFSGNYIKVVAIG